MKKPRKPKPLDRGTGKLGKRSKVNIYADFDDTKDCCVYIGGRYYQDSAQIHLDREDVKALAAWLVKADAYLSGVKHD